MTTDQYLIAAIRIVNAVLWIALGADLWTHPSIALPTLSRRLIIAVLVSGSAMLVVGGFTPFYIEPSYARLIYTAYCGFAALVALAVWRTWR